MRVELIGEAPARGTSKPFEGRSGKFLRDLLGDDFSRLGLSNLLSEPPLSFCADQTRWAALRRIANLDPDGVVLLLAGHRVARAFGVVARYFEPCLLNEAVVYVVPHPSGVNHWWNLELNRFRARRFFAALFMSLDGVDMPDGSMDEVEFRVLARSTARESGRVWASS